MQSVWEPQNGKFGIWPQLLSTLVLALFSAATAAFVGAGSVCFLRFFCTRQAARLILKGAALLSGLPSVLYGMIGMLFVVPKLGAKFPQAGESGGACLLAGWIVLSAMLISPMTLACADAADAADVRVIRASDALGATKTQTAFCCMLPLIRTARRAAFGQAFCRAAGEATAVLLVCGNVVRLPLPFSPVRTLSGTVVLEMGYAFGMHRSALFAIGLVLLAVSLLFPAKREPS